MPIVTLLSKLEFESYSFDCYINGVILNNQQINIFTVSNDSLWILTEDSHEISVRLNDFSYIDFDAIATSAKTSLEMVECFNLLDEIESYNAYLRKSKSPDDFLIGFYRIRKHTDAEES